MADILTSKRFVFAVLALLLGAVLHAPGNAAAKGTAVNRPRRVLSDRDCIKCHKTIPGEVDQKGMAHKTKIGCLDCHPGHPPAILDIIPRCSDCHRDQPHFTLPACLNCHTNPHTPLEITLPHDTVAACLTCHVEPGNDFRQFESFHASLSCTACHNRHGQVPVCIDCHKPHAFSMGPNDCRLCHQAHKPLEITYGPTLASKNCAACHPAISRQLASNPAKHRKLNCVQCHESRHKAIPACTRCHPAPHQQELLAKFPQCGQCHGSAHNLQTSSRGR